MRFAPLVLGLLLAGGALSALAPAAAAIDNCTSVTGNCHGWIVCVGAQRTDGHVDGCRYAGVRDLSPCHCPPPPSEW